VRILFYLPDRVIGGTAPPASHLVSAEMLRALFAAGIDVVAYALECRIEGPFWKQRGPTAPRDVIDAVDGTRPDLVWSYVAWEPYEIAPHLEALRQRQVTYVQSMTHLPITLTPAMQSASFLCESRLTWDLSRGFDRYRIKPFVPRADVYNGLLNGRRTQNYLFMHRLEKGLDCAIETCAAIRDIQTLYVTAERDEVEAACGKSVPPFVHCIGVRSGKEKTELMAHCDAAFYCSPEPEAIGMSPIECMLSGVPLLAAPRSEYGPRISVFEYIEAGHIPAVIARTAAGLAAAVNTGALQAIDRAVVRDRARAFFDNEASVREHVAALRLAHERQFASRGAASPGHSFS
jgi:hypothetical protein